MAEVELDIDDARTYVWWLRHRLDEEDLADLERRAAAGFPEELPPSGRLAVAANLLFLETLLGQREPTRKTSLETHACLAYLQARYPHPAADGWDAFLVAHPELEAA